MNDTYQINVRCWNCGFTGEVNIRKGTEIRAAKCIHCGCKSLHSVKDPIPAAPSPFMRRG